MKLMKTFSSLVLVLASSEAFNVARTSNLHSLVRMPTTRDSVLMYSLSPKQSEDIVTEAVTVDHELDNISNSQSLSSPPSFLPTLLTTIVTWATMSPQMAFADSPDWGIFEGRTGSLIHPLIMGSLFLYTLYTGFLGLQWKRQRTIGDDINDLKKSLPDLKGAKTVAEALTIAKSSDPVDTKLVNSLEAALSIDDEIKKLQDDRKQLAQSNPRDQHFAQGALLAFLGTAMAIEGPLNTYARAGKLFPGPHLYAGAGLVVIWALAFSMVPSMQKGNDVARKVHVGANIVGLGLFAWQVTTGIPILLKVYELTKWP